MKKLIIVVLFVGLLSGCMKRPVEPYLNKVQDNILDNSVVMDEKGDMFVLKYNGTWGRYSAYKVDTAKVTAMLKQVTK